MHYHHLNIFSTTHISFMGACIIIGKRLIVTSYQHKNMPDGKLLLKVLEQLQYNPYSVAPHHMLLSIVPLDHLPNKTIINQLAHEAASSSRRLKLLSWFDLEGLRAQNGDRDLVPTRCRPHTSRSSHNVEFLFISFRPANHNHSAKKGDNCMHYHHLNIFSPHHTSFMGALSLVGDLP